MSVDDEARRTGADEAQAMADLLERSLLKAVGSVEAELARVMRAGEADIERLARTVVEILGQLGAASTAAPAGSDAAASLNQVAAAVTRAARRGARFS